jgi:3-methylfumaryl-CoA hydratase
MDYDSHVGRTQTTEGVVTAALADVLAATLDRDDARLRDGDAIPPGWHWLYFPEVVKLRDTAADGHARHGDFFPELPYKRRMWAQNRMRFLGPLRIGERITRTARIESIVPKTGATGPLIFVNLDISIAGAAGLATEERMTYVFRPPPDKAEPAPAPPEPPADAQWRREIDPTPVLLFRFSALTMNSHRIHYDLPYVTREEGYPGLLVHGPLIQVLLVDSLRRARPDARIESVSVRAVSPLYGGERFTVCGAVDGATARLWAETPAGRLAMTGEAAIG